MRHLLVLTVCLAWTVAAAAPSTADRAVPAAPASSTVDVSTRPARIDAVLGDTVTVASTVTNRGSAPTGPLIAHLDVVSLRAEVYVDPEDWSAERSVGIGSLPAGAGTDLSWRVRTVDAGDFAVYVVLVPAGQAGPAQLAASPPAHLAVAGRRTLDAAGTLPVVLGVPAVVALGMLAGRLRRRRATGPAGRG
ncbi:MAG: hypothetical protein ACJ73E_10060 [Mycobacteriales bacterium]